MAWRISGEYLSQHLSHMQRVQVLLGHLGAFDVPRSCPDTVGSAPVHAAPKPLTILPNPSETSNNGQSFVLADGAKALAQYPHMRKANGFVFVSGLSSRRPDNTHEGAVQNADGTKARWMTSVSKLPSHCANEPNFLFDCLID